MAELRVEAHIVDVVAGEVFDGAVRVADGRIAEIARGPVPPGAPWLMPGLVDAHIHLESSLLVPSEFARLALPRGTVATVSDPHEIANVLGLDGVRFMVENGRQTPLKIAFGAPSSVPATPFETAGGRLEAAEIAALFDAGLVSYLSEVMNFPGVLRGDPAVRARIAIAAARGRPVDGHAPGLRGAEARAYAEAGIHTDHECSTLEEAREKIALGMKILLREGSAARDFEVLHPLIDEAPESVMLCSDDLHPDALLRGHIDALLRRALALGRGLMNTLRAATLNPVRHYGLPVGLVQPGDPADFILVDDLAAFNVRETWIDGEQVAAHGRCLLPPVAVRRCNRFEAQEPSLEALAVPATGPWLRVIGVRDGSLLTAARSRPARVEAGLAVADPRRDLLKIAVLNRYAPAPPAVAFVEGFGLRAGALASSVSHDSHNIVAVGASDAELRAALAAVVRAGGGLALAAGDRVDLLPLPVAGLMSDGRGEEVAAHYAALNEAARALGSELAAPFMTLSFMALLVIPALKLGDQGLFDGEAFQLTSLFLDAPADGPASGSPPAGR